MIGSSVRFVVPIRSLVDGFARLRPYISDGDRRWIAQDLAARVINAAVSVGETVVVTDAPEVDAFANSLGARTVTEQRTGGLDAAAAAGISDAPQWAVVHADLPLVRVSDFEEVAEVLRSGSSVLAPAHDGGSSLVGGHEQIRFAYGPGSFRRHLAALPGAKVLIRRAWLMDVDTADDVRRLLA